MQIRAACKHRQGFMGRIATDIGTNIQRVYRLRQKVQVRTVGIVHRKQAAVAVANLRKGGNVSHISQVVRRSYIHCGGLFFHGSKRIFKPRRAYTAGAHRVAFLRPQPPHLNIQQSRSVDKSLVHIPRGKNHRPAAPGPALHDKMQHCTDALA